MTVLDRQAGPVAEADRAEILDALRGFALLGIFISHIPDFSGWSFMSAAERAHVDLFGVDGMLHLAEDFLIRGKFYSLFSLLFGLGFALQLEGAKRRGADFSRHFARRLSVLLLIGVAHACLWYGDILKDYALIGFALILTRKRSLAWLAAAAAAVFALRLAWPFAVYSTASALGMGATAGAPGATFADRVHVFAAGDASAVFAANLELVRLKALQIVYDGRVISILSMFLLGAWIGRLGVHRHLAKHRRALLWVLIACAPLGLIGNGLLTVLHATTPDFPPTAQWVAEQTLYAVAVPALTFAYASGFALLWLRAPGFLSWLAPAGRTALSTYLSQTLIGVGLFYGVGFGLYGEIGFAAGVLLVAAIFALQCVVSSLWLRAFHFGPVEWLWRCATYGRRVPFVRRISSVQAAE